MLAIAMPMPLAVNGFRLLLTIGAATALPPAQGVLDASPDAAPNALSQQDPTRSPELPAAPVRSGLDVLVESNFAVLRGMKVGLITNHTAVDHRGRSIVDLFLAAKAFELRALFSPEHGFEGKLEGKVGDTKHTSGLRIHSLYGKTRKPTAAMLDGLDCLVFDIQDIGCRFYTYISTMGNAMQAAAERGLRFVVLDRPNPIGAAVEGPMLDPGRESFVGWHVLPVRHGMTVGELARLFRRERIDLAKLELDVVRVKNWKRASWFDASGLLWVNPSPNMRNLSEATLYPGVGLLETTNISVGRGTDTPFERIGAPWMQGIRLAKLINAQGLPGIRCYPIRFTPTTSKYKGELCQGVAFVVTDRDRFESVRFGFHVAAALRRVNPKSWDIKRYPRLLGNAEIFAKLKAGATGDELWKAAQSGVEAFIKRRKSSLLY